MFSFMTDASNPGVPPLEVLQGMPIFKNSTKQELLQMTAEQVEAKIAEVTPKCPQLPDPPNSDMISNFDQQASRIAGTKVR